MFRTVFLALATISNGFLTKSKKEREEVKEVKEFGCDVIQITASDIGTLLYLDYGFKENDNFMYYET